MLALARSAGLAKLAGEHLSVPTDKGANAGLKVASLVAGMVAGADSIELYRPRDYADNRQRAVAKPLVRSGFHR